MRELSTLPRKGNNYVVTTLIFDDSSCKPRSYFGLSGPVASQPVVPRPRAWTCKRAVPFMRRLPSQSLAAPRRVSSYRNSRRKLCPKCLRK